MRSSKKDQGHPRKNYMKVKNNIMIRHKTLKIIKIDKVLDNWITWITFLLIMFIKYGMGVFNPLIEKVIQVIQGHPVKDKSNKNTE